MVLISNPIFSQNLQDRRDFEKKMLPKDPLEPEKPLIWNNSIDFLINDSLYYDVKIRNIHSLKNGYLINANTNTDDYSGYITIFTAKEKERNCQKIEVGNTYKMQLMRYYEIPTIKSNEAILIYDVMLGKNTMNILSTVCYNYFLVTHNLKGLCYIDSAIVENEKKTIEFKETAIREIAYNFVNYITFEYDTAIVPKYMDIRQIKRSLCNHSQYFYKNKIDKECPPPRRMPTNKPAILFLKFNTIFNHILKEDYYLPKKKTTYPDYHLSKENINTKILYYSIKDNIYTVRIKWRLPKMSHDYVVIVSMKEYKNGFKIIGFNKVDKWYYG